MSIVVALLLFSSFLSQTLAASAPSEFRTGEFIPTARRVQYHGTRSRWVDLASKHCPRFGSDGLLAIPLPAPIVPPTKRQMKRDSAHPLLHGTYKVQFAFDGERVLTPWLTVAREDLDGKKKKKSKKREENVAIAVADVPVVDLVLARAGRELLGGGASRARVSRAPQDYVAAHGGLADEWRTTSERSSNSNSSSSETEIEQKWPRTLPVRVRWAARPGADLAAGASTLLVASLLASLVASLASLVGHGSVLRGLVEGAVAAGAEEAEEVLMGGRSGGSGGGSIGAGRSVQLATTAVAPPSAAAAAFQYQYQQQQQQQQQQAPAPQPRPQQQQQQFVPPQQPAFAAPAPALQAPPHQQYQRLPSITPPPASFTPQQQYAYYQRMHSYQRQQQGQGQQQQAPPFSSQQQQQRPAAPPLFQQQQPPPSSSKAD